MKRFIALLFSLLFTTAALAADNPIGCSGASCSIKVGPRTSGGATSTANVTAFSDGVMTIGDTTDGQNNKIRLNQGSNATGGLEIARRGGLETHKSLVQNDGEILTIKKFGSTTSFGRINFIGGDTTSTSSGFAWQTQGGTEVMRLLSDGKLTIGGGNSNIAITEQLTTTATASGITCTINLSKIGHNGQGSIACSGTVSATVGTIAFGVTGNTAATTNTIFSEGVCQMRVGGVQEMGNLALWGTGVGMRIDLTRANGAGWVSGNVLNYLGTPYFASTATRCTFTYLDF